MVNMMEITTNRKLDNNILTVIKDTLEDSKQITILNIFIEDDDVYGVYLNSLEHSLSFLQVPEFTIHTEIDGHYITFIELGFLLRSIYNEGTLSLYNWLLHPADIECVTCPLYNDILELVQDNPPLNLTKMVIINQFDDVINSNDKQKILELVQQLYDLRAINYFDMELDNQIDDMNDMIRIKNQLNAAKQTLQNIKYDKISEKKIHDINNLYISLQRKI